MRKKREMERERETERELRERQAEIFREKGDIDETLRAQ